MKSIYSGLDFGNALGALKNDLKVSRDGWNGKGMWLQLVPANLWSVHRSMGGVDKLPCLPWVGMRTACGEFVPWLASQADLLADDWCILDESSDDDLPL